jgi:hypothetical protein
MPYFYIIQNVYSKKYRIKLGSGWSVKDDEFLQNKLAEIKLHYDN